MTEESRDLCAIAMGVKRIERCCGSCKFRDYGYDGEFGCTHKKQMEFADDDERELTSPFGAEGFGVRVSPDCVCDLWERNRDGGAE